MVGGLSLGPGAGENTLLGMDTHRRSCRPRRPRLDGTCHSESVITSHSSSVVTQQLFMEPLLWARLCPRGWGAAVTGDRGLQAYDDPTLLLLTF